MRNHRFHPRSNIGQFIELVQTCNCVYTPFHHASSTCNCIAPLYAAFIDALVIDKHHYITYVMIIVYHRLSFMFVMLPSLLQSLVDAPSYGVMRVDTATTSLQCLIPFHPCHHPSIRIRWRSITLFTML
jgi:Zn-finger protein